MTRNRSGRENEYNVQQDILLKLNADIGAGLVACEADGPFFALIRSRFPIRLGGIAWEQIEDAQHAIASRASIATSVDIARTFFERFRASASVTDIDKLSVVGDGGTTSAFVMPAHVLRNHMSDFIDAPHAFFVLTAGGDWCFNYTFQGMMYYGHATR